MLQGFVTFEGGEGAGKTTQIRMLADALRESGTGVLVTREPGGSPLAERLRSFLLSPGRPALDPETEATIFAAARSDHLAKTVIPGIERGNVVLCDRFADSTYAYQGQSLSDDFLDGLNADSVGANAPCLTVILDIVPEVGLARAAVRRQAAVPDQFEARSLEFHRASRRRFLSLAERSPSRYVVVDADRDAGEVHRDILDEVLARLGHGRFHGRHGAAA